MKLPPPPSWMDVAQRYRRLAAFLLAVLLIAACFIAVQAISASKTLNAADKQSLVSLASVLTNLAAAVIVFFVASIFFLRENQQQQHGLIHAAVSDALNAPANLELQQRMFRGAVAEALNTPGNLQQVPWVDLIENAEEIDFVVQGWNGWAENEERGKALARFFERGGVLRLYVCHPKSRGASRWRQLLEQRIGRTPASVVEEIQGTYRSIREAREQALEPGRSSSRLELYQTDHINWYAAASFKGRSLPGSMQARDVIVFSIYSHTPVRPWLMPAILAYPDMHDRLGEWFAAELAHLRAGDPGIARGAIP